MPLTTSNAPSGASPLWIIALFIALSEVTAGVASITTDGAARLLFAIFAVAFPIGVFVVFVWLLTNHAPKLYPPREYSGEITPEMYAAGVSRNSRAEVHVYGKAVAELLVGQSDGTSGKREELADQFQQAVVSSSVEVEIDAVAPERSPVLFPVDEDATVRELLDALYFAMAPHIRPFQYLESWALVSEQGTVFDAIGTAWARKKRQSVDDRRLAEVGIFPGDKLRVIPYPA
ncbi:hypothetical protein AB0E63_43875 [Kribbella sp. NPDC026596]|uniref:hypothetical protein n=1 Tax=Kribbella sp. NPDC026596 TaxID=3155122 RepID=UPI0033D7439E